MSKVIIPSVADINAFTPATLKAAASADKSELNAVAKFNAACAALREEIAAANINIADITKRSTVGGAAFQAAFAKASMSATAYAKLFNDNATWITGAGSKGRKTEPAARAFESQVGRIAKRMKAIDAGEVSETKARGKKGANKSPDEATLDALPKLIARYKRDAAKETPENKNHAVKMKALQDALAFIKSNA